MRIWVLIIAMAACAGCSSPEKREARLREKTFITHWAPSGTSQLRLAIKDNIDMKGVVTSAGSQYLYKNGRPAARDAECLRIARARHVAIVGRTNMSEFAVGTTGVNDYFGT